MLQRLGRLHQSIKHNVYYLTTSLTSHPITPIVPNRCCWFHSINYRLNHHSTRHRHYQPTTQTTNSTERLPKMSTDNIECNHQHIEGDRLVTDATYTLKDVGVPSLPNTDAIKIAKIVFLGTGSAIPSPGRRNTSGIAVILNTGSTVLLDCGEATQHQIMKSASVKFNTISTILITHLHGDHCFGLFGLLCTVASQGRTEPVVLVGPVGLRQMVTTVLGCSGGFGGFEIQFLELEHEQTFADLGRINLGLHLAAFPLKHRVASFGYVLTEGIKPGALDVNVAKQAGAQGKQLGRLKEGHDVTLDDGRIIRSADCVSAPIRARKIALLQDTYDSSTALAACANVDLLIHECTYSQSMRTKSLAHGHSTSEMVGEYGAQCNAQMILMTHFSNRYETSEQTRANAAKATMAAAVAASAPTPNNQSSTTASSTSDQKKKKEKTKNVVTSGVESQLQDLSLSSSSTTFPATTVASPSSSSSEPDVDPVLTLSELCAEARAAYEAHHPEHRSPPYGVHAAEDYLVVESLKEEFKIASKSDRSWSDYELYAFKELTQNQAASNSKQAK